MPKRSYVVFVFALGAPLLLVIFLRLNFDTPEVLDDPSEGYRLFYSHEYAEAEELCLRQLEDVPGNPVLLSLAARAASALNQPDRVQAYYRALPQPLDNPDSDVVSGFSESAERLLDAGHMELAEELLRWSIEFDPWHFDTNRRLARLLRASGRRREGHEHFVASMRGEPAKLVDLLTACSPDIRIPQIDDLARRAATVEKNASAGQLGLGMIAFRDQQWPEAETHIRRASAGGPAAAKAHAMTGLLLVEQDRWDELPAWYESLTPETLEESEACYAEGRWASHRGEPRAAVRFFAEAVRSDPMNLKANEQLAATLRSLDLQELAEPFQQQFERLIELRACAASLPVPEPDVDLAEQPDTKVLKRMVELLDELGREWEAGAWAQYAETLKPPPEWAYPEVDRIASNLSQESPPIIPAKKPILGFPWADFPFPTWSRHR